MAQTNQVAVRLSVEGAEEVRAKLLALGADGEAALKRLNFDTATGGSRLFEASLEEAGGVAREYAGELGPLGGILSTLGGGWLAAGAAAAGFGLLIEQGVEKAEAYEQAMRGVDAVLNATGLSSGVTREQIAGMADEISEHTLQTRESVLSAAEELATFGVEGPEAFKKVLDAASDLAASPVFHGDLAMAVKAIALAADGTFTQLQRAGVKLTETQKQQITAFDEAGDHAGAFGVVVDALSHKIGGAGAAQDQGLTGATHNLGEAWDKLMASMGQADQVGGTVSSAFNAIAGTLQQIDRLGKSQGILNIIALRISGGAPALNLIEKDMAGPDWQGSSGTFGDGLNEDWKGSVGHLGVAPQSTGAPPDYAGLGVALAHNQAVIDAQVALGNFADTANKKADELAKAPLAQAIDKAIDEAAKKANISPEQLRNNPDYGGYLASVTSNATRGYNNQHAEEFAHQAEEAARKAQAAMDKWLNEEQRWANTVVKDVADQEKLYTELVHKEDESYSQLQAARDSYLLDATKGTNDYWRLASDAIDHWLSDSQKALQSEEDAQIAALDAKKDQYAKDAVGFQQYQNDLLAIKQTYKNKADALDADAAQRRLDLWRKEAGALQQFIDEETADWNQSLKQVAADGLNEIDNDIEGLIKGTESLGKALKALPRDILADLGKKAAEKFILGPIGDELNSLIDGGTPGKPDGSSAQQALWVRDATGTSIPGVGANGEGLGNLVGSSGGLGGLIGELLPDSFFGLSAIDFAMAEGGHVRGPGGPTDDAVPILASNGEFVVNARSTRKHSRLLEAINDDKIPHFASGGMVGGGTGPEFWPAPIVVSGKRNSAAVSAPSVTVHNHYHLDGAIEGHTILRMLKASESNTVKSIKDQLWPMMTEAQSRYA